MLIPAKPTGSATILPRRAGLDHELRDLPHAGRGLQYRPGLDLGRFPLGELDRAPHRAAPAIARVLVVTTNPIFLFLLSLTLSPDRKAATVVPTATFRRCSNRLPIDSATPPRALTPPAAPRPDGPAWPGGRAAARHQPRRREGGLGARRVVCLLGRFRGGRQRVFIFAVPYPAMR